MLARTKGPKYKQYPCYVQPKLNGIRALYQHGRFQSRDEKFWLTNVLQHLYDELASIAVGDLILDGELYVHGWKLQRINSAVAVNRLHPTEDTRHVNFYIFDVVDPSKSFSDRWFEVYHGLMSADLPHIRAVATTICHNENMVDWHFKLYGGEGYEGIMLRPDGPYEFGEHMARHGQNLTQFRSRYLWKHKHWEDGEFRCINVTDGEGKADIGIGALVCWTNGCGQTFKVGTGFSDEERIEFKNNPPIGRDIKVRYLCLTNDGVPFNPSFQCVM